ncbi:lanthionine synthetase C family protein [Paenibacillus azoreducens]|uniref:lanthionine synthetase C family protein n=1 Tax=Paenibacillus azoreducens TaxID=116718 RepID=UPI0039F5990F
MTAHIFQNDLAEKFSTARAIGVEIANRMKDPKEVRQIITAHGNISIFGEHPWRDTAFSAGYPGIILLFAELDRQSPEEGWDLIAHQYLLALQEGLQEEGYPNSSMFGGLAGIAFAAYTVSRNGTRYTRFIRNITDLIIEEVSASLKAFVSGELWPGPGISPAFYDVIMGLSGSGRYLLEIANDDDRAYKLVIDILKFMVKLTDPITVDGYCVPGWYVPQRYQFTEEDKEHFPKGNFNCGLAHGIPGPLVLMSKALQKGIKIDGQVEAIQRICEWLINHAKEDESGLYWPSFVSFEEETANDKNSERSRDAWCYGTAGVARALFLAGSILKDEEISRWGIRGYDAIYSRPEKVWNLTGPTFCHGYAGLLYLTLLMAKDTQEERYEGYIERILDPLMDCYDTQAPLGYKDIEIKDGIDKAGILDGAAGIALVLISLNTAGESEWNYPFLIS